MGGRLDPKTRLLCRQKIEELERKLEEIEALKALEPKLRRELHSQKEKLAQLPDDEAEEELQSEEEEEPAVDAQKRLKALNKKLKQIQELKAKGGVLEPEAAAKVASEPKILREMAAIKAGRPYDESVDAEMEAQEAAQAALKAVLPVDAGEREKRLKALNKKLQQIAELKKKEGLLDDEARAKLASKPHVKQEIAALERGDAEVVFTGPTEDDLIEDAMNKRIELEKKLKAVRKKLTQIEALKEKDSKLEADAQAKVDSEPTLKKELGSLERQMGSLNRAERERVAKKLGWEEEPCPDAKRKPRANK